MANKLELMLEAEKRGLLSPEKLEVLNEARSRGLVEKSTSQYSGGKFYTQPVEAKPDNLEYYKSLPRTQPSKGPRADIPSEELQRASMVQSGMTFGLGDELAGMMGADTDYLRKGMEVAREERPWESLGLEIGGGVLSGQALAKMFPNTSQRLLRYASRGLPQAATTGAGVGAVSGGVYGLGTAEGDLQQRIGDATEGALFGGIAGPVGVALPSAVGAGVRGTKRAVGPLKERALKLFGPKSTAVSPSAREIAEQSAVKSVEEVQGPTKTAVAKIEQAIKQDFGDNADSVIQAWKSGDTSLAELYGAKTRQLAKGVAQYPTGQKRAEIFFDEKVLKSPELLKESISKNISGNSAYYATVDDIIEAGRAKAKPYYDKIKGVRITPTEKNIDILTSPEVQSAYAKAKRLYPSKLAGLQDDSVEALDYVKRVLDDDINKAIRAGESNLARSRTQIKNELVSALDEAVPEYAKARKASGDYLSLTNAMDKGKNFMKVDPELLSKQFKSLSEQERTAFRSGVSKQIRDLIDKTPEGQNVYNRVFGRPEQKKRLQAILNPTQFKNLQSDMKAQDRLFKLRNEVLGGSPTTSKAMAAAEIASVGADLATATASGASVRSVMPSMLTKMFDGLNDKTAKSVADILFEERPSEKLKMINALTSGKGLTKAERASIKKAYFDAEDLFKNAELQGAIGGGIYGAGGE